METAAADNELQGNRPLVHFGMGGTPSAMCLGLVGAMLACAPGASQSTSQSPPSARAVSSSEPIFQPDTGPAPEGPRADRLSVVENDPTAAKPTAPRPPDPPPPPPAEERLSPELAASPAAARVVKVINAVKDSVVKTRYKHRTRVHRRKGYYAWDCSGMAEWMLKRSAPRALRALDKERPRAIHFYRGIARAPTTRARRGWRQLGHVSEARPGDLFAFPRSPLSTSPITGHVGFFVEAPWPVPGVERAWAARIVDSTRTPHQDDTRSADGVGGFGFGTMMFVNDESGKTIAYGWYGTRSRGYMPTHVVYGRVTR